MSHKGKPMVSQRKDLVAWTGTNRVATTALASIKTGSPELTEISDRVSALRLIEIRCFRFEGRT
ncbi:hypothetical protein Sinme_0134 [Sinorhizobium meliloti AK83]|nr:hypothetical protein Sinme_0134 [Sinorhizobium meliloti AK83]